MMQRALRPSALVPRGFDVESAVCDGAETVITVRPTSDTSLCPGCGASSGRIHSRYQRRLTDLPLAGRPVRLVVVARRFRCVTVMCGRRIFTERFEEGALAPWARRTARLDLVVHHLGLALGGRPAAGSCPSTYAAREQRYATSGGSKARVSTFCCAERDRHRRLGLAAQSAVRNNHLRPRAATTDHSLTRQRASHCASLARGATTDRCGRARPRRRLRPCCDQGTPARHPGRRPLAPHGECQPRLPRCGSQIHAPSPRRGRLRHHKSRLADRRQAASSVRAIFGVRTPTRQSSNRLRRASP